MVTDGDGNTFAVPKNMVKQPFAKSDGENLKTEESDEIRINAEKALEEFD